MPLVDTGSAPLVTGAQLRCFHAEAAGGVAAFQSELQAEGGEYGEQCVQPHRCLPRLDGMDGSSRDAGELCCLQLGQAEAATPSPHGATEVTGCTIDHQTPQDASLHISSARSCTIPEYVPRS